VSERRACRVLDQARAVQRHCAIMLGRLLPVILLVFIDHGTSVDWGPMCYPPVSLRPRILPVPARVLPEKPRSRQPSEVGPRWLISAREGVVSLETRPGCGGTGGRQARRILDKRCSAIRRGRLDSRSHAQAVPAIRRFGLGVDGHRLRTSVRRFRTSIPHAWHQQASCAERSAQMVHFGVALAMYATRNHLWYKAICESPLR
jgi:hypothetical protein